MRKVAFPCRKNITARLWICASYQTANFLLLLYQNIPFLVFLISTIVKCDLLRIVITLHHANFLSQRSKPRRHPSLIRRKSLFHLVICSFRVSSCDKKNLKWIFIPYDVLWNSLCVLYPLARGSGIYIPSPEARGYKTHNSFHNTSYGMKNHLRSYMYVQQPHGFETKYNGNIYVHYGNIYVHVHVHETKLWY